MVTEPSLPIFVKLDGHLGTGELQSRSFQHHLAGVFPALRCDVDFVQRLASCSAYPAMNVRIVAAINAVENPVSQRRAEVTVQFGHGPLLDTASEAATHDKLRAFSKFLHEWCDLTKVVGQVRVAH